MKSFFKKLMSKKRTKKFKKQFNKHWNDLHSIRIKRITSEKTETIFPKKDNDKGTEL